MHCFGVPINASKAIREPNVENIPPLVSARTGEHCAVVREPGDIPGHASQFRQASFDVDAAKCEITTAVVPVPSADLDRLRVRGGQLPPAVSVLGLCSVVGLMQIRHVTQRHKSLQIEGHELTPESYYERSTRNWFRDGNERLFEIERIPIDWD
jgi:hypothetical protein